MAMSFPVHVYPRHGTRNSARFESTAWSCPETIIVVGTPALLDANPDTDHRIQLEVRPGPASRTPKEGEGASSGEVPVGGRVASMVANSLGISTERLLEAAQIDAAFLTALPDDMAHELLMRQLDSVDIQALVKEGDAADEATSAEQMPRAQCSGNFQPVAARTPTSSSSQPSPSDALSRSLSEARPAEVAAGSRLTGWSGPTRLLIEKFDFHLHSAPATLGFGVHEELRLTGGDREAAIDAEVLEETRAGIAELLSGRRERLLDEVPSVYANSECVICLSGDPKPDAVLYQCGHRCVHVKCVEGASLQRCPLCRARIVAVLPV